MHRVKKAIFSSNGKTLLTSNYINSAILWSVTNGEILQTFDLKKGIDADGFSYNNIVEDIIYNSKNNTVITAAFNGSVVIWNTFLDDIVSTAITKLDVNRTCLNPSERKEYFLTELTNAQWIERGCGRYTKDSLEN